MNRSFGLVFVFAVIAISQLATVQAQVEPIFTFVPPGPPGVEFFFPNVLVPPPNEKLFRFVGGADNSGFPGITDLTIFFDWVDSTGGVSYSPPFTFPLLPFMTNPIDTGFFVLPFCPQMVSIHFETPGPPGVSVSGDFSHICRPIPEPAITTVTAGFLAVMGSAIRKAKRRRRNTV